ncbi:MAG: XRE family transcriptional regulator [Planctomycetota bacterium]|nr:MAG: XRE family transcriptional regulator [Planctomycetota bacterium]
MTDTTIQIRDLSPPGEILAEAMEERGIQNAELARRAGLSEKHVSQLINARVPLSMDVALQLERVLGIPARLWINLEFNYRAEQKRDQLRADMAGYAHWMRAFPVAAMRKAGYFGQATVGQSVPDRVEALLEFFGVTSPRAWESEWAHATGRFRKSPRFNPDGRALTAWLRRAEIESAAIRCEGFRADRFRRVMQAARSLSTSAPEVFVPELVSLCASSGVALTLIPALPKLAISGVTRWKGPAKALVSLSLRHRSDDQLWFSFFHECCHVLEHKTKAIYIDSAADPDGDPVEQRANAFARDVLIPPDDYARLVQGGRPSLAAIKAFAVSIGISPGIVVGRLQHEGVLGHQHGNGLKRRFAWEFEH